MGWQQCPKQSRYFAKYCKWVDTKQPGKENELATAKKSANLTVQVVCMPVWNLRSMGHLAP